MNKVHTDQAPQAVGPYSQAIVAGNMVFCSGQIPLRPDGTLEDGDVAAQTHQVMRNLRAVLEAAGSSLEKVVSATCFLRDMNDFAAFNQVYSQYLSEPYPARVTVQAARLPRDVAVEVACIAVI
ncbi:RidA family protein [Calidithermus chliarophilus]|uniref:RidA family protein n=1 Tax=Calidithermus chliarophilus TaxID=52023 RepID=UPI0003FC6020|nr:RidA family protein [Calidithermus chliarophilus]